MYPAARLFCTGRSINENRYNPNIDDRLISKAKDIEHVIINDEKLLKDFLEL